MRWRRKPSNTEMQAGDRDQNSKAHLRPLKGLGLRRGSEGVIQIFADDRGLNDNLALVDQGRDDTFRIEL